MISETGHTGEGTNLDILKTMARVLATIGRRCAKEHSLSGAPLVLSILSMNDRMKAKGVSPRNMKQNEVAKFMGVTPQAAGQVIASLEESGLVERLPDENDRRVRYVVLTEAGRAEAAKVKKVHDGLSEEVLSCLTGKEKAQLWKILQKMAKSLDESETVRS